jgi:hypothetical protein
LAEIEIEDTYAKYTYLPTKGILARWRTVRDVSKRQQFFGDIWTLRRNIDEWCSNAKSRAASSKCQGVLTISAAIILSYTLMCSFLMDSTWLMNTDEYELRYGRVDKS